MVTMGGISVSGPSSWPRTPLSVPAPAAMRAVSSPEARAVSSTPATTATASTITAVATARLLLGLGLSSLFFTGIRPPSVDYLFAFLPLL